MWNPFNALKQSIAPAYLGVDIGTTSIKAVEVNQGEHLPRVVNYAFLDSQNSLARANAVIQTSTLKLFEEEAVGLLKTLLAHMKPRTSEAIVSLPGFAAFTAVLNFPQMSEAELKKTMPYQAKQYIPLPLDEVAIEPIRVGEFEDEKGVKYQQILLITVPLEQIKRYQEIFKKAGLHLRALEIESMSLVRSVVAPDPTPTFIVDIGSRASAIVVVEAGRLKYTVQSDYGGAALTQALSSSLGINPLRAEELKRERGVLGTGPNYELSTIMLPFLDVILNEVKKAEFTYASQFPAAAKIERIILSGGGANLPGIENYFKEQMGIPVVKAAPWLKFEYPPEIQPFLSELNPLLAVALGLTLREFQN